MEIKHAKRKTHFFELSECQSQNLFLCMMSSQQSQGMSAILMMKMMNLTVARMIHVSHSINVSIETLCWKKYNSLKKGRKMLHFQKWQRYPFMTCYSCVIQNQGYIFFTFRTYSGSHRVNILLKIGDLSLQMAKANNEIHQETETFTRQHGCSPFRPLFAHPRFVSSFQNCSLSICQNMI